MVGVSVLASALVSFAGCSPVDGGSSDAAPSGGQHADAGLDDVSTGEWSFYVLEERSVEKDGTTLNVELIRADRPGGSTYLMYVPAGVQDAPLAVLTNPYVGIDWTGDEVDIRWHALGEGYHDDVDAPDWDGDDQIYYTPQTVDEAVDGAMLFIINGISVVRTYGRFYAGGSLQDDCLDSVAPYYFALSRPDEFDLERIASFGMSWGGMMAVFGAVGAPAGARPIVVAAVAPPTDFSDFVEWALANPQHYAAPQTIEAFWSPYLRRIYASTGGPPPGQGYASYSQDAVCGAISGQLLLFHDEWDTLVPVRQSQNLAVLCPGTVQPMYWYRQTPLDFEANRMSHGPFDGVDGFPTSLSFALLSVLSSLGHDQIYAYFEQASLRGYLGLLREEQLSGASPVDSLPRLQELADPRVVIFQDDQYIPGAQMLAEAFNAVYGTNYDAETLRLALQSGLPDPG